MLLGFCWAVSQHPGPWVSPPGQCQNGGTWDNGVCQCLENFQGDECQFAKETIEVKNGKEMSQAMLHHTGAAMVGHQPRTWAEVTSEGPAWEWGHHRESHLVP